MQQNKTILRRTYELKCADTLIGVPALLQGIYAARSITASSELDQSLNQLYPYQSLLDIEKAAHLLKEAIVEQKKILIVGDFDADGATSTAIAIRSLKSFGAVNVDYLVPNRFSFGYGLTKELVEAAIPKKPDLILTVDNGIVNHAGVTAAKNLGQTVIITDHHLAGGTLPDADAIVNPNQPNDPFPSKCLAGCGVIFYVMLAVRKALQVMNWFEKINKPQPNMARLLDLVATGTVADLVPLDRNNRILIHQGLLRIRSGQGAPGIIALLECAARDFRRALASDLGFAVGARLNAAGRLDDMSLGIEALLSDDPIEVRAMAKHLDQLNKDRRIIEYGMQEKAQEALNDLNLNLEGRLPKGLCLYDDAWHQGVIGILASRIKDRYYRPVIVFAPGQEGELKGSARSIPGLHIRDLLALMDAKHPKLIEKFGGHAMAAGLTIARNLIDQFAKLFEETIAEIVQDHQLEPCLLTDGALLGKHFNLQTAAILRDGGPWGQAFPEPLFDNIFQILDQRIVGGKHLKLSLSFEDQIIDAIVFFVDLKIWPNHHVNQIRAIYRLDINEYQGHEKIQLIIDYLEPI